MSDDIATLVLVVYVDSEWYVIVGFWYVPSILLTYGTNKRYVARVSLSFVTSHWHIPIIADYNMWLL